MLYTHFFSRHGIVCYKSLESYGGFIENLGEDADISGGGAECNDAQDTANTLIPESNLLPSEVDSMSENQSGASEHGTLVSGEVEDPDMLRQQLREMLK